MEINGKSVLAGLSVLAVVVPLIVKAVKAFGKWMCSVNSNPKNYFGGNPDKDAKPKGVDVPVRDHKVAKEGVRSPESNSVSRFEDAEYQRKTHESGDALRKLQEESNYEKKLQLMPGILATLKQEGQSLSQSI